MMSNKQLIYDSDHMDAISARYKQCADHTEAAISDLDSAKASFMGNYRGQSDEMAPDLFAKIKGHMEFLRDCFSQMGAYVAYTKDTMAEQDRRLAKKYRK